MKINATSTRLINGYGPEETDSKERIAAFYTRLEEEIISCSSNSCEIILQLDANAKLGNKIIPGDPNDMSPNGRLFLDIITRNNLFLVNSSELCKGIITRKRSTINGDEESVIDYLLTSDGIKSFLVEMIIDEERVNTLTKFASEQGNKDIKPSDHNVITGEFSILVIKNKVICTEIYTLRDEDDLAVFKDNIEDDNNLIDCFNDDDFIDQANKWF